MGHLPSAIPWRQLVTSIVTTDSSWSFLGLVSWTFRSRNDIVFVLFYVFSLNVFHISGSGNTRPQACATCIETQLIFPWPKFLTRIVLVKSPKSCVTMSCVSIGPSYTAVARLFQWRSRRTRVVSKSRWNISSSWLKCSQQAFLNSKMLRNTHLFINIALICCFEF